MGMSQKVNGVMTRNLRYTLFYMKANILQDFHIDISVPLTLFRMGLFGAPYGSRRPSFNFYWFFKGC